MDIDYSGIPHAKKTASVLDNFKTTLLIVLGIATVLSLGAYFTRHSNEMRDIVMPILSGLMIMAFIGAVLYSFWIALTKLRKQSKQMQKFAFQNSWTYQGKQLVTDESLFPPGSKLIPSKSWIAFRIDGKTARGNFSLYLLEGLVSQPVAVRLITDNRSFGYLSVIRTAYQLPSHESGDYYTANQNEYGYAVHTANALNQESLSKLFSLIELPNPQHV